MPWVVYRNGNIQNVNIEDHKVILASRAGSGLTEASAQSALARGSARLTLMPADAVERIRAYRQALMPSPAAAAVNDPGEIFEVPIDPLEIVTDETPTNGEPEMAGGDGAFIDMGEGSDLRDGAGAFVNGEAEGDGQTINVATVSLPGTGVAIAAALLILRRLMGNVTRIGLNHWNQLPGWARTALTAIGITVGVDLALDVPGVPGESTTLDLFGGDGGGPHLPTHMIDGHLGAHIVGSWTANGVTFYRLSDGKLAVQNKHGRWKVWRPKRPIVLMPGGANNLRTLLKADAVLNRQAKNIAKMLNRRAPRPRKPASADPNRVVVVQNDGNHRILN